MLEHLDDRARRCLALAQDEARRLGHEEIGTVHLLLGVAGVAPDLLGVEIRAVRAKVVALQGSGPPSGQGPIAPFSSDAKTALEGANRQALRLGHTVIEPAHVLLALLDAGGGAARALREAGATPAEVRERANAAAGATAAAGASAAPGREPQDPAAPGRQPQDTAAPGRQPQDPAAPGREPQGPAAPGRQPQDPAAPGDAARAAPAAGEPAAAPRADHALDLRNGRPVAVALGADAQPLGDLGDPRVDARLLELMLVGDTAAGRLLRDRGIDEARLRTVLGPAGEPG